MLKMHGIEKKLVDLCAEKMTDIIQIWTWFIDSVDSIWLR